MKRLHLLMFFSLLLAALDVFGQVVLQPLVPRIGIIQKSQLWDLVTVNSSLGEIDMKLGLVLQDRVTGYTLLTAESGLVKVGKGAKQLNERSLFPIRYQYEALFNSVGQQSLLPVGNYLACYTATEGSEKAGQLARVCIAIDVTPLSPPMLAFPLNNAKIAEKAPQFIWTPPSPATLFNKLRYDIIVTEVSPGQSVQEAVQRNPSLFEVANISAMTVGYPASSIKLDTGKVYAWQVTAKNGDSYSAKSDAWAFQIRPASKVEEVLSMTPFVRMSEKDFQLALAPNGILKFIYKHVGKPSEVEVTIEDISAFAKKEKPFKVKVSEGDNYLQEAVSKHVKLESGHIYMASITTAIGTTGLRFEVRYYKEETQP